MRLKKKCNLPKIFRGGMFLLFVVNMAVLYMVWRERSTYAELRFHLMKASKEFHGTPQCVEKQTAKTLFKEFVTVTARRLGAMRSVKADFINGTSVQNNTANLLVPGPSATKNGTGSKTAPLPPKKKRKVIKVIKRVVKRKKAAKPGTGAVKETITKESCGWRNGSGQNWCFNRTEVLKMRQHILRFYNPEANLTLTQSSLKVGQNITYELHTKLIMTPFNVTEDFLQLVPKRSPLADRHFNTCAVVGNSGIVLNSNCGKEIDSMDFVMRCNLPPIEGYEKDVGSKANFTTMNPSVIPQNFRRWNKTRKEYNRFLRSLKQVGDQILYVPAFTSPYGEKYVRAVAQIVLQHKLPMKMAFPPTGQNNLMKSIWRDAGFEILRPSTGAHMYTLAATICDQIHMYGFYPFTDDARGRALRYHYYDRKKMISNRTHNMPEEFRAFQQLHLRGAVVLHTEPCH